MIIDWNRQAEITFGWSREEAIGRELAGTIIPPEFREPHRNGLERFRRTGKGTVLNQRLEMSALHRDGHELPVEFTISVLHDDAGEFTFHAFLRDVTEHTRAQEELRASEERFRLLVETVEDYAIFMLDAEGRIATWNRGAERIKGYTADEIVGREIAAFYPPEDVRAGVPQELLASAVRDGSAEAEGWRLRKDGTRFWANTTLTALRDEEGNLRGFSKITRDKTRQRVVERYMAAQHAATEAMAQSGPMDEAIPAVLEAIGTVMDWQVGGFWMPDQSSGGRELTCLGYWDALGQHSAPFETVTRTVRLQRGEGLPGRIWESCEPAWIEDVTEDANFPRAEAAEEAGIHAGIGVPIVSGDEVLGVIEFLSNEIRRPDPELLDALDTISNQLGQFVQRKLAETEADRLKAEFFALVSHELRTPLTSMIGYLDILLEDGADELPADRRRELLSVMDRNSRRLLRLVGDLLFAANVEAGQVELDPTEFDLAKLVEDGVEGFRARVDRERIELHSRITPVGSCFADPDRIGQVVDNLVSNAVKFTPPGGSVTVLLQADSARWAVLEVSDTGIGIPESEHDALFERFYRASAAKEKSIEGTGLGLAIVKVIAEGHGGSVSFESAEGKGSTFRVRLPLA